MNDTSDDSPKIPIRIPNTEILSRLGVGGMARVYLGRRSGAYGFEKLHAIKIIDPKRGKQKDLRAMFLDEARLLAQLDHPTITQVYDFGESDGFLYLIMEYAPGPNLADLMVRSSRPPPLLCASMMAEVCRGLHAAHEITDKNGSPLSVVHRDVTPQNLVLTFGGRMKILDFGIALMRARTAPVTLVGFVRGKPSYLAPEQFLGERVDRRTDIYSTSIVLHELITGQRLFDPSKRAQSPEIPLTSSWQEIAESIPSPSSILGEPLPDGLEEIVMRGLAADPDSRFQDARAMAIELEAIIQRDGCETLGAFVDRELGDERDHHTKQVRLLQGGMEEPEKRSTRPKTLIDESPAPAFEEPPTMPMGDATDMDLVVAVVDPAEASSEPETVIAETSAPSKRMPMSIALGIFLLVVGATVAALVPFGNEEEEVAATTAEAPEEPDGPSTEPETPPVLPLTAEPKVDKPAPRAEQPSAKKPRRRPKRAKPRSRKKTRAATRKARKKSPDTSARPEDGIITEW